MAREKEKDFNQMMNNSKDMPKIINLDEKNALKYGGKEMIIASPKEYDEIMKEVPFGKVITTSSIREKLANKHNVKVCDPMTAGIFINICAWASYQRKEDITPFWRTLKTDGELNSKYPEGVELQKKKLEEEGQEIICKTSKNGNRYFVKDYINKLVK